MPNHYAGDLLHTMAISGQTNLAYSQNRERLLLGRTCLICEAYQVAEIVRLSALLLHGASSLPKSYR
jgi:hypothetical protein